MSIDIEPSELNFRRPFTVEVSQTLTLRNTSSTPLAFKVKTTAPKQYCVRPNAGRIEPGQDFDVTVLLQAMKADPPLDSRCRDKFLVQSAAITADKDFANIATLDSTDKSHLQERKIRVNWLAASNDFEVSTGSTLAGLTPSKHAAVNGADTPDISRTYSSPSGGAVPPPYTEEVSAFEDDSNDTPRSTKASASGAALFPTESRAKAAPADLSASGDTGLRQRAVKTTTSEKPSAAGEVTQATKAPDGVSVQMVAILCLLSFLLAYFFF
ncbi:hypothetical protein VHEMI00906 [[Torrubiella] hemipterigena]|uniref:MSP domain-containing protein n=1 Tax=[Torrubiella] hemipterigena TaxID=1531966 RepID=A0A0A1T5X3_9HYPO|nr:hypothetical protein VHEMI00906 [[Torrubiella] hemipterigena]